MGWGANPGKDTRLSRLVARAWTGSGAPPLPQMLGAGAVLWLAYAGVWLFLEGPVLDEAAIAAPVIAGNAGYPPGHPNAVVYRSAVALLYQLGALQWLVHPDPWWISATRNVAFLFLSTFVPFALVVTCTRRPAWGHVAAVLTLSETVCSAVGVYLMWVFPGVYSSGHIGIHLAVLSIVLLLAGMDRLGGVIVGLLPAIHAAMVAVVWPVVACLLLLRRRRGLPLVPIAASVLTGLVAAGAVAAVVAWRTADDVALPPYDTRGDGTAIIRTFIRTTDPHRQPLPIPSAIGLVAPVASAIFAGFLLLPGRRRPTDRAAWLGVALAGAVAWGWALGARALQGVLGELPLPLAMAMPARFANLGMLLVVPLAVGVLATSLPPRTATILSIGLIAVEGLLLLFARQLAFVHLLPVALGVACGAMLGSASSRVSRSGATGALLAVALVLLVVRAPDGTRLIWGFVLALAPTLALSAMPLRARGLEHAGGVLAVTCLLVALVALRGPHFANAWDIGSERQSAEETALGAWLHEHARPHAMLLAAPFPPTWLQPKTGHPVLFDMITLLSMTYFPREAEPVARLVGDVFDVDYADPAAVDSLLGPDGMLRPSSPVWLRTWGGRSCATWYELGTRWGFDFVLAPRAMRLRLQAPWSGSTWTLYEIPRAPGACGAFDAS
jgi:hypothetical protein